MANEFRVEKSPSGYRVALYRNNAFYVTFVDGLTLAAAERESQSLTIFWQRIQSRPAADHSLEFKAAP